MGRLEPGWHMGEGRPQGTAQQTACKRCQPAMYSVRCAQMVAIPAAGGRSSAQHSSHLVEVFKVGHPVERKLVARHIHLQFWRAVFFQATLH